MLVKQEARTLQGLGLLVILLKVKWSLTVKYIINDELCKWMSIAPTATPLQEASTYYLAGEDSAFSHDSEESLVASSRLNVEHEKRSAETCLEADCLQLNELQNTAVPKYHYCVFKTYQCVPEAYSCVYKSMSKFCSLRTLLNSGNTQRDWHHELQR